MINLDDPETIGVLADLLQLQINRDRISVLAIAATHCPTCGAHQRNGNGPSAAAAGAVAEPEHYDLDVLKRLRPHGRLV